MLRPFPFLRAFDLLRRAPIPLLVNREGILMKSTEAAPHLRVAENITELVGATPILHLRRLVPAGAADLYAKLEYLNPGGSVKDRAAIGMIEEAERSGRLKPGGTIVEATAGNTGVGLALIGVNKGYKVVFFVPERFSMEKIKVMEALGARVIRTPDADGMQGAIARAKQHAAETPNAFVALQFENQSNPEFHERTTAVEIFDQMEGRIDAVVIGVGTGGTFSGVARYMKQRLKNIRCIAVETEGSVLGGGPKGDHKVEGIGASFIPGTFDRSVCDEIVKVSDADAFQMVKDLARNEGVLGGSSAGANVFAAVRIAKQLGAGKRVVTVIPDLAERYMSKKIFEGGI
jgi:cysteine synthase A